MQLTKCVHEATDQPKKKTLFFEFRGGTPIARNICFHGEKRLRTSQLRIRIYSLWLAKMRELIINSFKHVSAIFFTEFFRENMYK